MSLYLVTVCYNARQDTTIQHSTIHSFTMTHITHNNKKLKATLNTQNKKKNQERILYPINTHNRIELKQMNQY